MNKNIKKIGASSLVIASILMFGNVVMASEVTGTISTGLSSTVNGVTVIPPATVNGGGNIANTGGLSFYPGGGSGGVVSGGNIGTANNGIGGVSGSVSGNGIAPTENGAVTTLYFNPVIPTQTATPIVVPKLTGIIRQAEAQTVTTQTVTSNGAASNTVPTLASPLVVAVAGNGYPSFLWLWILIILILVAISWYMYMKRSKSE